MKTPEILKLVREEFKRRLNVKTNWGRNQIMSEYERAISTVLLKIATDNNILK